MAGGDEAAAAAAAAVAGSSSTSADLGQIVRSCCVGRENAGPLVPAEVLAQLLRIQASKSKTITGCTKLLY